MPDSVGALEITISKSSDASAFSLKALRDEISKLKKVTSTGVPGLVKVSEHIDLFSESVRDIPELDKFEQLRDILAQIKGIGNIKVGVKTSNVDKAVQNAAEQLETANNLSGETTVNGVEGPSPNTGKFSKAADAAERITRAFADSASKADIINMKIESTEGKLDKALAANKQDKGKIAGLISQLRSYEKQLKSVGKSARDAGKSADKASGPFSKLVKSIGRVMFYRAIRSAIKEVTQALAEGRDNLYQWSKLQEDAKGNAFAKSLDKMSSSFLYLKNSIAAAFAPFVNSIAPYVQSAIETIVNGLNYLSKVIATLMGNDYYYKATYQVKEYKKAEDSATDSANKLKKTLLGIDELNVLDSNSASKNKKDNDTVDYSSMFEKVNLPKDEQIAWAAKLKLVFDDVLTEFKDVSPEGIAKKIILGLGGLIGAVAGFSIGGVPGAIIGTIAGITLAGVFNKMTFNGNGKIDDSEIFKMVKGAANVLLGAATGFVLTGSSWGALAGAISGIALTLGFDSLNTKLRGGKDESVIIETLFGTGGALAGGLIGWSITHTATGTLIGATIGANLSITFANFMMGQEENIDAINKSIDDFFTKIRNHFAEMWNDFMDFLADDLHLSFAKKWKVDLKKTTDELTNSKLPQPVSTQFEVEFLSKFAPNFDTDVSKFNAIKDKDAKVTLNGTETGTKPSSMLTTINGISGKNNTISTVTVNGKQTGTKASDMWGDLKKIFEKNNQVSGYTVNSRIEGTKPSTIWSNIKSIFSKNGEKSTISVNGKETGTATSSLWSNVKNIFSKSGKTMTLKADATKTSNFKDIFSTTSAEGFGKQFGTDFAAGFNKQIKKENISFDVHFSSSGTIHSGGAKAFATGGHPTSADLFYANENGVPEMVGRIGNQTTVATNSDIVAAVSQGVASAVGGVVGGTSGDVNVNVYLDGNEVYNSVVKHNRQNTVRTGQNALA